MTFAFGLFTAGLIIAVAAAKNTSVASVLSGSIQSGASTFNLRKGGSDSSDDASLGSVVGDIVGSGAPSKKGKIIGTPYAGTHNLGNWQSDNAIDIALPRGTPIFSVTNGKVTKTGGQASESGRFGGFTITIQGAKNAYFYAHLSKLNVKAGDTVSVGEIIGKSGSANGVAHLHFGMQHGDPRNIFK